MWNARKSAMLSLVLTYVFMVLLVIGMIALPMLVTWYVEYKGREASLPTTIMLTLYPCAPFAAYALWTLQSVLKNILNRKAFTVKTSSGLGRISWCAFAIMAIMLFSGRFYLPFYVCAMCAGFMGLILRVFKNLTEGNTVKELCEEPQKEASNEETEEKNYEKAD